MKRTAAQMADALAAVVKWEAREGGLEAPAFKQTRAALRAYERAKKQPEQPDPAELARALRACKEYIGVFHDSRNRRAPTVQVYRQAADALAAYDRAKQPERPSKTDLASALRAILEELNGPMRGYWTESMDNREQAASEALAAYDRAQQPKPKGAPGRCQICRHYGDDCTCYRRKGARRVRS